MQILAATSNENKIAELSTVAEHYEIEIIPPQVLKELNDLPEIPDVKETGPTYAENALLKAKAFAEWGGMPALGDDSGLEVTALNNRPGVNSKRYAGEAASDMDRCHKIISELAALEREHGSVDRRARFRCHLALYFPEDGQVITEEAVLEGEILRQPRGLAGFGYDPIVFLYDIGATLAEVDFDVTCTEGFRAIAAKKLYEGLRQD